VVLADRYGDGARAEAARIVAAGGRAEAAPLDVRAAAAVDALVTDVLGPSRPRLDYLFNNAGIAVGGEARVLSLEDWREAVEVDLMASVHGVWRRGRG